jgi:hypothetical protein
MLPNAGGQVYGTILVATLLSAEAPRRETYARTVGAVVIMLIAYWLTVAYAEYAGERLEHGARFEYAALVQTGRRELALLYGALVPLVILLVFWAAGASLNTAVAAAVWCAALAIVVTEVTIGIRADLHGRELVRQTGVGILLGLAVIAMRVLLH